LSKNSLRKDLKILLVLYEKMKKKAVKMKKKSVVDSLSVPELKEMAHHHHKKTESEARMYRMGFWVFFVLVIFSVTFSVWAISSIYSNFQVVTKILDQSFERTNLVLDITSSRIAGCQADVKECYDALEEAGVEPPG
jgi:heme/copper-type cytochrome/quinol oxidase subunit 3